MKCPNSWTRIKIPSTTTNATIVVTATYLPASFDSPSCRSLGSCRYEILASPAVPSAGLTQSRGLGPEMRRLLRSYPFFRQSPRLGIDANARLDGVERAIRHPFERFGDQLGNLGEADCSVKERRHRHLVGRIENCRGASAFSERLSGELKAREPVGVGLFEREGPDLGQIQPGGVARKSSRIAEGVQDGDSHIGDTELRNHRAVEVLHHRMDDRLGMDQDLDLLRGQVEEPARFDDLEPLVHQCGGVYRDLRAHFPRRMLEGLVHAHPCQLLLWHRPEWSAGRREQDAVDIGSIVPLEALEDRAVL